MIGIIGALIVSLTIFTMNKVSDHKRHVKEVANCISVAQVAAGSPATLDCLEPKK